MSNDTINWDQFAGPTGDFPDSFKFEAPGASVAGTITRIRVATIDGKSMPELYITTDDGKEWSVLAGQMRLQKCLSDVRPQTGDRVAIVFTRVEPRSGGKTLKHFEVGAVEAATGVKRTSDGDNVETTVPDGAAAPAAQPAAAAPAASDLI